MTLRNPRARAAPAGFTLIELMVALVISMLLIIAVSSTYLSQRMSYNTQGDIADIQANARAIAQLLMRDGRLAGYSDFTADKTFDGVNIVDGTNDLGVNTSDTLTFRYYGASKPGMTESASGVKADGTAVDCAGNVVDSFTMTTEIYSIVNDASGVPWLQCAVNGNPGTLLFRGVERFQILFGEDIDGNQSVDRYTRPGVANPGNVVAIVASLVLRGNSTTNPNPSSATLNHFGKGYAPADTAPAGDAGSVAVLPADGRLRKHFTFYIAVRNRLN